VIYRQRADYLRAVSGITTAHPENQKMPTTIYPAGIFSETSEVSRDRNSQAAGAALLIAWAIILLMVAVAAPPSPEATAMDPFQLLATF
jgi:hypothetical protein